MNPTETMPIWFGLRDILIGIGLVVFKYSSVVTDIITWVLTTLFKCVYNPALRHKDLEYVS